MYPISSIPSAVPPQTLAQDFDVRFPNSDRIPGINVPLPDGAQPAQPGQQTFGTLLGHFVEEVNNRQNTAADAVRTLQSGGNISLHETVLAMEEASISFQLMIEVRNKLLEAYQEIMRMQV